VHVSCVVQLQKRATCLSPPDVSRRPYSSLYMYSTIDIAASDLRDLLFLHKFPNAVKLLL